jgi:1-deoxy-D-xylulose-5-phosphate synthase
LIDIKHKDKQELEKLAQDIRKRIIDVVSKNGGHFSSTLGAVELIIAMHKVFDCYYDPFVFDVSHQCYAHKLITGRWKEFDTLRQFKGISGFTKPKESSADYFVAGHSSTSISLAVGAAKANKLNNGNKIPIVMIGDGSMTAGMVYEALNELGDLKLPVIIILNDNEMSIAKPIGAMSKHLSKLLAGRFYQGFKRKLIIL